MYTKAQFEGDYIKAYGYLGFAEFKGGKLTTPAVRYIDTCYRVYKNSGTNSLGYLVIGRIVKKDGNGQRINLQEIGYGLDDIERSNFGTTNAGSAGSVLSADDWTVSMNDAWLMGGIHACLDFYVASPRTEANILDPTYGNTVTGRELLGLTTFGYSLSNTREGEGYVCTDQGQARTATFVAYQKAVDAARAGGGFSKLVNRNVS